MASYGVYTSPLKLTNQPGKFAGSNTGGSTGNSVASGQGTGKDRIYYIQDANGLHVGQFGPFQCLPQNVQAQKASFETMINLMVAAP